MTLSSADAKAWLEGISYGAIISTFCLLLAWAPARLAAATSGSRSGPLTALLWLPILLPPYLAYAGWSLLRAPGTWLGDAAFRLAQQPGFDWLPVAIGRSCAVIGLACWAWPLAAMLLAGAMRARGRGIDEQLATDGAGPLRAFWSRISSFRLSLVSSWLLVLVVMLGSAIPLHVAQAQTYTLRIWLRLDQSAPDQQATIWLSAWPAWIPAIFLALLLPAILFRRLDESSSDPSPPIRPGRVTRVTAWAIWSISTLLPLALFARELLKTGPASAVRTIERFVLAADQELQTAGVLLVASTLLGCFVVIAAAAVTNSARAGSKGSWLRKSVAMTMLGLSAAGALVPGVLIGSAIAQAANRFLPGIADGPWLTALASWVRSAIMPIGAGVVLALAEPGAVVSLRRIEVGESLRGWLRSWAIPRWAAILAASLAFGVLSFHEIEAAVQVASPMWPSLPRKLLNLLHFARNDDLSAAVLLLHVPGLVLLLIAASLWRPVPGRSALAR